MIKPINMFKNAEQASILRTKAAPAAITPELRQLIEDLKDTCLAHPNCAGLSSNQIWTDPVNAAPAVFVQMRNDWPAPSTHRVRAANSFHGSGHVVN